MESKISSLNRFTQLINARELPQWLEYIEDELSEGAMKIDGFDDCICGIVERFGMDAVLLYHTETMIEKMVNEDGMDYDDAVEKDLNSKYDLPQDTVELTKEEIESKNRVNEEIMKLIMYRSQRKWYATISIISIFGGLLIMMLSFIAMQKDLLPEWKEVLLLLLGAFVGSFSRVIDHWFNNSQAEEKLLESANT